MQRRQCDILVIGGGLGGVAAALKATSSGAKVIMTEESDWIGGQITSQGVSALDEHPILQTFGGTKNYNDMKNKIRQYYKTTFKLSERARNEKNFNPGESGNRVCFEPKVGLKVLNDMLKPATDDKLLDIYYNAIAKHVVRHRDKITSVTISLTKTNKQIKIIPKYVIDATELGDILPLANIPYRTGVESYIQTREPSAPNKSIPNANQGFTFSFAVEWCPGENHTIPKPALYNEMKQKYPFTLNGFKMFDPGKFNRSFWAYRRIISAENFNDSKIKRDISLINWKSTDYHEETIIDQDESIIEQHLYRAKQLSLSFLYWLQTEAPRDDGGFGFPELKLRPDIMGTEDGLSKSPYIRESRRMIGLSTIREQDIVYNENKGARSRLVHDSIGIGTYYYIDIHPCSHTKERKGSGQRIQPFQIPLGALITQKVSNFITGSKNISSTHITNGTSRLHPIEWAIGEAAGSLAAYSIKTRKTPPQIYYDKKLLSDFQINLLTSGTPLFWFVDLPLEHENFVAVQYLALKGIINYSNNDLYFKPNETLSTFESHYWIKQNRRIRFTPTVIESLEDKAKQLSRGQFAQYLYSVILEKFKYV